MIDNKSIIVRLNYMYISINSSPAYDDRFFSIL